MSCSDYKTLSEGYLDNTMSVRRSMIEPYAKVPTIQDLVDEFTNLVFSNDPRWYDCSMIGTQMAEELPKFGILKDVSYMQIIRELERQHGVKVDSISMKETPTTFSVVKLCSGNSILNNTASNKRIAGTKITRGGEILPYTHSEFRLNKATKSEIFSRLTQFLEKQGWSKCTSSDYVSTCEFNLNAKLEKDLKYNFGTKNPNPHIIQVIDMLHPMLRLKYEIIIFGDKVIFSKLCKNNIDRDILPNMK